LETKKGIGPSYCEKMNRSGIRVGDLKNMAEFAKKLKSIVKNAQLRFKFEYNVQEEIDRHASYAKHFSDFIVDGVDWINEKYNDNKTILVEGANAAMLDIDFGTYPYVTSSNPTIGGCLTGLGLSANKLGDVIGVVKAYTTRVGEGPFPTELTDSDGPGHKMRHVGGEYGTTTGRPRRCGWFDAVIVRYTHRLNGYTALNLTKVDVLTGFPTIKVATAYKLHGKTITSAIPASLEDLSKVEVVYEELPGWTEDISKCTKYDELPKNCQAYVHRLQQLLEVPIKWIGVGAGRQALIHHN